MMSSQHDLKGPLLLLLVGTLLLYLPSSIQTGLSTFWADPNPYAYQTGIDSEGEWADVIKAAIQVVQLVGVITFIRGLILLSHLSGGHGQQGTMGKGMAHIIGGVMCINIYQFWQMIKATLGIP